MFNCCPTLIQQQLLPLPFPSKNKFRHQHSFIVCKYVEIIVLRVICVLFSPPNCLPDRLCQQTAKQPKRFTSLPFSRPFHISSNGAISQCRPSTQACMYLCIPYLYGFWRKMMRARDGMRMAKENKSKHLESPSSLPGEGYNGS